MSVADLGSLGARHRANKPTSYFQIYGEFLAPLRERPVRLLELGIATGASLLMWRDYFPAGLVSGIDWTPPALADTDRIAMYAGSQDDLVLLDRAGAERGPFDVIVDDCAHLGATAEVSFWHLFCRHLRPGGLYAIEDWGTGYWPDWPDGALFERGHTAGMVGFVKSLVDECGRGISDVVRLVMVPGLVLVTKGPA